MTSNRYKINDSNFIIEILDDGVPMHYSTIVNRLNEQHETIERLKRNFEALDEVKCELAEENGQLKQLVNIADDLIDKLGSETMQNEWIKNF